MLNTKKIVLVAFLGLAATQVRAASPSVSPSHAGDVQISPELQSIKGDIALLQASFLDIKRELEASRAPGRFSKAASTVSSGCELARDFLKKPRVLPVINKEVTVGAGLGVAAAAVAAVAGVVVVGKQGYLNRPVVATKGFLSGAWARVPAMPRLWGKKAN